MEANVPSHVIKALEQRSDDDTDLVFFKDEKSDYNPMGNDIRIGPGKCISYAWPITPVEHQELVGYLGEEYGREMISKTYNTAPQETCKHCGTPSTFSDIVSKALGDNVHNSSFMLNAIKRRTHGDGQNHVINCKSCGKQYEKEKFWPPSWL
ncbi:uncharacterized protein K452DRAFT_147877 [Aplosporella prunicola CBS 121167]|uniref:Uncharacterized protein n=1 Tax=Aplosporella prunicola CBS 121167 TaxID=1176127 RepID=A0A6A6BNH9_9PEZI|nr:uncharacterized protein K452DRAFT_147877 [Aplosporella prunicola CBS 121167]KAF2144825.1 hypothetical protein K452DRAFT_147877 [Aplosporella prunicola CBS 121167]